MAEKNKLLQIRELGGYPDFSAIYEKSGYQVETATSMRKALRMIKQHIPDVIVAEFNFQSDFRDRTSSLETLMAAIQQLKEIRLVIFYEKEYRHQFEKLRARFSFHAELPYPIDTAELEKAVDQASARQ